MINDLEAILSEGESYTVEFKESPDKSLLSEVCAFANASGGKVYIGVSDDGKIVGTDTGNTARSRIQDSINKIEPRLHIGIELYGSIMVLTIPEGTRKPYSCPAGFFLRSGPNSQKLDHNSIIDFIHNEGKVINDTIVNDEYLISDNFRESEYDHFIALSGISDALPREAVLKNLSCAGVGFSGNLSYTNAGLLFFRDNRQDVFFDFTHITCALYKGKDKSYIIDAKHLNGSIIENIDNAMVFLKRNLKVRYEIKTTQRKNILELPEDALREAVINAVCHRDYYEKGACVMVEIFDDRVEITNPGSVPKGITKENFGSVSVTRNPIVASLLHRIRYIERMGSGIIRMTRSMEEAGCEKPVFQTEGLFFKVTFIRNRPDYADNNAVDGGLSGGLNGGLSGSNGSLRVMVTAMLKEAPETTVAEIGNKIGVPIRTVERIIAKLKTDGIITRVGSKKSGYWQVTDSEGV